MSKKIAVTFTILYILLSLYSTHLLIRANLINFVNGDSQGWVEFARQIHVTHEIGTTIWWPPLYALLISPISLSPQVFMLISLIQAVLYLGALFLVQRIIAKTGTKIPHLLRVVIFGVLLCMPSFFLIGRVPLAETVFLLFYLSHGYFLVQFIRKREPRWLGMSVIFLVLTTSTKPTTFFLHLVEYPGLFVWFLINKIKIKHLGILLFFAVFVPSLIYGLWMWRNYTRTGVFVFANVANYNLLAHNYIHLAPYIGRVDIAPGEELQVDQNEVLRHKLFNEELPQYIYTHTGKNLRELSQTQLNAYAGQMARDDILKHLPTYIIVHYLKSAALFMPDNWETLRHIWPTAKIPIIAIDVLIGIVMSGLFVKTVIGFIKNLRSENSKKIKTIVQLLACINIVYLFSIVGPTALDDGGRFSFVVYPWLLLFFATSLVK